MIYATFEEDTHPTERISTSDIRSCCLCRLYQSPPCHYLASDLYVFTGKGWRTTTEGILSTWLCGLMFSLCSMQPLIILGATGPFSVLAQNMYDLCIHPYNFPFLPVMAWTFIQTGWMHCLLAVLNAHD
jgi:HCO3- transporter family